MIGHLMPFSPEKYPDPAGIGARFTIDLHLTPVAGQIGHLPAGEHGCTGNIGLL